MARDLRTDVCGERIFMGSSTPMSFVDGSLIGCASVAAYQPNSRFVPAMTSSPRSTDWPSQYATVCQWNKSIDSWGWHEARYTRFFWQWSWICSSAIQDGCRILYE